MKKQLLFLAGIVLMLTSVSCNNAGSGSVSKSDTMVTTSTASTETPAARNKRTIMESMDALNRHDVDAVFKNEAPDAIDYGDGSMPPMRGADSTRMMLKSWMAAFPDFKVSNMVCVADDNTAMVASDCSGTWKGELMGMKPSGKSFSVKDVDIFTFNDKGQVTSHRSVQNMGPVYAAIGMKMPGTADYDINPRPHSEKTTK